jgi:hypothetical protein
MRLQIARNQKTFRTYPLTKADSGRQKLKREAIMETLFDGKYNQLIDNAALRITVNAAVFTMWLGAAFVLLAVR